MSDAPPAQPQAKSLLSDPLTDWPNDDLLFDTRQRTFIHRRHPKAAPIFDWQELRDLFGEHDPPAGHFRKRSRRTGVLAVALGCASLILTATLGLTPAAGETARQLLAVAAALLALASGVTGYSGVLSGGVKRRWLAHRFWTERMRQLHFQLIVNNLPLAARAISDSAALNAWMTLRGRALDSFVHRLMEPMEESLDRMERDVAEDQPWVDSAWEAPAPAPAPSEDLAELFEILKYQRFGIQKRYAALKLRPGVHSPKSRSRALRLAADTMTLLALVASAAAAVLFVAAPAGGEVKLVVATGAILAALILGLRVLDEGLQLRSETERYEWYLAAVEALERRFDMASAEDGVRILREMERLSYQELRWFIVSFGAARFVM